jgi:hypothetical protein
MNKRSQVLIMGEIYASSVETIVWLGKPNAHFERLLLDCYYLITVAIHREHVQTLLELQAGSSNSDLTCFSNIRLLRQRLGVGKYFAGKYFGIPAYLKNVPCSRLRSAKNWMPRTALDRNQPADLPGSSLPFQRSV